MMNKQLKITLSSISITFFLSQPSFAALPLWLNPHLWSPVFSFGVGGAAAELNGANRFIVGESFYRYNNQQAHNNQTVGSIALGAEYLFNPCWTLQANIAYYQPEAFSFKGQVTQGVDSATADTYNYEYQVISRQLLLEGKLISNAFHIHPYLAFGIGAAFNTAYGYNVTILPPWTALSPLYASQTSTSFSYNVGTGIELALYPNVRLGAGYRFTSLGQPELGAGLLNLTSISQTPSTATLYANEYFVQLSYILT